MYLRRKYLRARYLSMKTLREGRIKKSVFAALLWHSVNESSDSSLIRSGMAFHSGKLCRQYFDEWKEYKASTAGKKLMCSTGESHLAKYSATRAIKAWKYYVSEKKEHDKHSQALITACLEKKYIRKLLLNVQDRRDHKSVEEYYANSRAHVATKTGLNAFRQYVADNIERKEVMEAAKRYHTRLYLLRFVYKIHIRLMYSKMKRMKVSKRHMYLMRAAWRKLQRFRGVAQRERVDYAILHHSKAGMKRVIQRLLVNCRLHKQIRQGWLHFKNRTKKKALHWWDRTMTQNKRKTRQIEKLITSRRFFAKMRKGIIGLQYYAHMRTQVKAVSQILLRKYFKICQFHRTGKMFMRLALTKITTRSVLRIRKFFNEWKEHTLVERTLDVALSRKGSYQKFIVLTHWRQLIAWKRDDKAYKSHMIFSFISKQDTIFQRAFYRRLRRLVRYRKTNQRMAKRAGKIALQKLYEATHVKGRCRRKESALDKKADNYYYRSMLSLGLRFLQFQVASNKSNRRILHHNERRHKHSMLRATVTRLWYNAAQARKTRVLERKLEAYSNRRKKLVALQILDGVVSSKWASEQSLRLMDVQYRKMALLRGVKSLFHHARHRNYQRRRRVDMR
jgi:hypothetical protein